MVVGSRLEPFELQVSSAPIRTRRQCSGGESCILTDFTGTGEKGKL